jgi:hypothetical protein
MVFYKVNSRMIAQNRAIGVSGNQRSFKAVFNERKSFAALERAAYSASVVDVDTNCCICDR